MPNMFEVEIRLADNQVSTTSMILLIILDKNSDSRGRESQ